MALREKLAKYNDVIERAIRKTALQGRVDQFGNLAGTSRVFGYVCKIHDNDDPDENLRNTVDVQEYNYDEEDYDDQAVGFHEGVLLSAIQGNKGFFIVPQLFSEVVIVQDPANKVEYVTMYSHAKIIQLQSVDEVNIGVKEYEDFSETGDRGIEKDYDELEETGNTTNTTYKSGSIVTDVANKDGNLKIEEYPDKMVITRGSTTITITDGDVHVKAKDSTIEADGTLVKANGDERWAVRYEDLQALLEKLFNKIGSGICKNGSPLTTAPEILAMVSEIPKIQSHKVKLT